MDELEILKEKAELVSGNDYQKIRNYQIDKVIALSTSNIEPLELKGMLKLISYTDNFKQEYEKKVKKQ